MAIQNRIINVLRTPELEGKLYKDRMICSDKVGMNSSTCYYTEQLSNDEINSENDREDLKNCVPYERTKNHLSINLSTHSIDEIESNFYRDCQNKQIEKKYIFRVNCMDCLDRTNLGQFIIFSYFSKYRFKVIRKMWLNNGNALSNLYTGSNALKGELACKGNR